MPNTLVHFGIQGALSRAVVQAADIRWVFLGCMIPDLPWILRRAVTWTTNVDAYQVVAYCTVQASLAFCLVLAAALACLSSRSTLVFGILSANSLFHLLLDTTQVKWGAGVHLLAPFSWEPLSFALFWPDSLPGYALTLAGVGLTLWLVFFASRHWITLQWRSRETAWLAAGGLLAVYLLAPLTLLQDAIDSDARSLATLQAVSERVGKPLRLDRVPYIRKTNGAVVVSVAGEELMLVGENLPQSGSVSLKGTFIDSGTVQIEELHADRPWLRDGASYLGLLVFVFVWLRRDPSGSLFSKIS